MSKWRNDSDLYFSKVPKKEMTALGNKTEQNANHLKRANLKDEPTIDDGITSQEVVNVAKPIIYGQEW